MNKGYWIRKYLFLLTACILVVSLLLPGCGGKELGDITFKHLGT
jgi:hypothetical protein